MSEDAAAYFQGALGEDSVTITLSSGCTATIM